MLLWKGMGGGGEGVIQHWVFLLRQGQLLIMTHFQEQWWWRWSPAQQITWWWSWSYISTANIISTANHLVMKLIIYHHSKSEAVSLFLCAGSTTLWWPKTECLTDFTEMLLKHLLSLQHKTTNGQEVLFSKLNHLQICQFHSIQYSHLAYYTSLPLETDVLDQQFCRWMSNNIAKTGKASFQHTLMMQMPTLQQTWRQPQQQGRGSPRSKGASSLEPEANVSWGHGGEAEKEQQ